MLNLYVTYKIGKSKRSKVLLYRVDPLAPDDDKIEAARVVPAIAPWRPCNIRLGDLDVGLWEPHFVLMTNHLRVVRALEPKRGAKEIAIAAVRVLDDERADLVRCGRGGYTPAGEWYESRVAGGAIVGDTLEDFFGAECSPTRNFYVSYQSAGRRAAVVYRVDAMAPAEATLQAFLVASMKEQSWREIGVTVGDLDRGLSLDFGVTGNHMRVVRALTGHSAVNIVGSHELTEEQAELVRRGHAGYIDDRWIEYELSSVQRTSAAAAPKAVSQ
jgi:hypothetical protein